MTFATGIRSAAVCVSVAMHAALIAVASPQEPARQVNLPPSPTSQLVEFTNVTRRSDDAVDAPTDVKVAPSYHRSVAPKHEPHAKNARFLPTPAPIATEPTSSPSPARTSVALPSVAHFTLALSSQWSTPVTTRAVPATTLQTQHERDVVSERDVSTRAKLLSAAEVSYPPEARASEIEAEVPIEIVVDARGLVADARTLGHTGYGLDDAALRAIRGYRFTPATRDGLRVAVRMRWQVSFRLR